VQRDFGKIRFWGTLGWIVVGFAVTIWLSTAKFAESETGAMEAAATQAPAVAEAAGGAVEEEGILTKVLSPPAKMVHSIAVSVLGREPNPQLRDIFTIGGVASILLGVFCFFLPHTPPAKKGDKPWAFAEAFKLCKDWHFMVFLLVSFMVGALLMIYFIWGSPFLAHIGVKQANVSSVLTLGQGAELLMMALLPMILPKIGIRKSLIVGLCSWPILFGVFAASGAPMQLQVAVVALHGIGYGLFFTVSFIYVDSVAAKEIRASAQSLQAVILFGLGPFIGSKFAGWLGDHYTQGDLVSWAPIFLTPCIILAVCALVFIMFFKQAEQKAEVTG
jgi:predicted MFS family arabinose efflux permease